MRVRECEKGISSGESLGSGRRLGMWESSIFDEARVGTNGAGLERIYGNLWGEEAPRTQKIAIHWGSAAAVSSYRRLGQEMMSVGTENAVVARGGSLQSQSGSCSPLSARGEVRIRTRVGVISSLWRRCCGAWCASCAGLADTNGAVNSPTEGRGASKD